MEPYGAKRLPVRNVLNLRLDKAFKLGGGRKFTAAIDAFNALNSNAAWAEQQATITEASGPTYGFITRIVTPRILRFSVGYEFYEEEEPPPPPPAFGRGGPAGRERGRGGVVTMPRSAPFKKKLEKRSALISRRVVPVPL